MFNWFRMQIDKIILNDHDWKKKYCPCLYHYLFEISDEERHRMWINIKKNKEELCQN